MDETRGKHGVVNAWIVLGFIFVIFLFLLNKYGKEEEVIYNQQISVNENQTREQVLEDLKREKDSALWNDYIDKIALSAKDKNITPEEISENYQKELENKVTLPTENLFLQGKIVGDSSAEVGKYLNEFEILLENARKRGVFSEAGIFRAQAVDSETNLELSDFDKQTLLRIATEYELWAKEIGKLDTPKKYENKSLLAMQDILQMSYVLEKIVEETDSQVYVMWIGKYTQKAFDILANTYVK